MKKINKLMPFLGVGIAGVSLAPVITLTSCGEKVREVKNAAELRTALQDTTIGAISLKNSIRITDLADTENASAFTINRPVKIYGNGNIIDVSDETRICTSKNRSVFNIDVSKEKRGNIVFDNLKIYLEASSIVSSTIIANNIQGSHLKFNKCTVKSNWQQGGTWKRYYALRIERHNIEESTITIENESDFEGWAAIYNLGSKVRLTARNSKFIGVNDYEFSADAEFGTIIASDHPVYMPGWSGLDAHCFSADNDFKFTSCTIEAQTTYYAAGAEVNPMYQLLVANRSAANNTVTVDESCTCTRNLKASSPFFDTWFATIDPNRCTSYDSTITVDLINNYSGSDKPSDFPENITSVADDYFGYYATRDKLSKIIVPDKWGKTRHNGLHGINSDLVFIPHE